MTGATAAREWQQPQHMYGDRDCRLSRVGVGSAQEARAAYRADRPVVVTGMGMITPVGLDLESSWNALREGQGGVGPISLFDAGSVPTQVAAEIKGFGLE